MIVYLIGLLRFLNLGFNPWKGLVVFESQRRTSGGYSIGAGFNPWKGLVVFERSRTSEVFAFKPSFNPWKGLVVFESAQYLPSGIFRNCFNPWKGLVVFERTVVSLAVTELWVRFNPWKGLVVFESPEDSVEAIPEVKFQSLKGISGLWKYSDNQPRISDSLVSIPERD